MFYGERLGNAIEREIAAHLAYDLKWVYSIGSLEVTGALKYLIILKMSLDLGNNEK